MAGCWSRPRRSRGFGALVGLIAFSLALTASSAAVSAQQQPPQRAEPAALVVAVVWQSVGETRNVDVSSAFVGAVDSYTATSDNPVVVRVSTAGSVVSLSAEARGVAFVEVTATNTAGSTSVWISVAAGLAAVGEDSARGTADAEEMLPVEDGGPSIDDDPAASFGDGAEIRATSTTPQPLAIVLSSWAYCRVERPGEVRAYDDPDPVRHSGEVARFNVNYKILGGRGPFVVSSPHALSAKTDVSGVLEMACANPDPDAEGPVYRVDLYNPIEVSAEVTDAEGTTASATMTVGRAVATRYVRHGDGTVSVLPRVIGVENPENHYVVATPAAWTKVTLLPNVDLRFRALGADGIAHFADAGGGSEVWVDWTTAAVSDTRIVVTGDTYSHRVPLTPELEWEMSLMSAGWPWEERPSVGPPGLMDDE